MDLLYTVNEAGAAVFAERTKAEANARIREACESANTWREFRSRLTEDEYVELLELGDLDADDIALDEDFDANDVWGYADGDYPEWLQQTMLGWFPPELITQYGKPQASIFNGDFLELPGEQADEIAESLRAEGHRVTRCDLQFM